MEFNLIDAVILGFAGVPFCVPSVRPISPIIPRERTIAEQVIDRGLSKLNKLVGGTVFGHLLDFIRRKMGFVRTIAVELVKPLEYAVKLLLVELFSTEVIDPRVN